MLVQHVTTGWRCYVQDGNTDLNSIRNAIEEAKKVTDKPSFIKVSTLIGYGSPNKADTHGVHGSPLGKSCALPIIVCTPPAM